ncbi:MAG: DsbA family protein [Actinomycetota bacterium]|nr:DsbA family protein [Actinomycetota bacterium]
MSIAVTHFSDPGCPWAYSINPALAVLRWRYGDQLDWRLVTVGLTERPEQYEARGYTPALVAHTYARFRRYGMPFAAEPRARVPATGRACRAVVATRLRDPDREWAVFRALQLAWFNSTLLLDEDDGIVAALRGVEGLDASAMVADVDRPEVVAAYEADKAEARTAAGSPTAFQGKAAQTDGPVRYTAPSLIFSAGDRRLEAGGFQTVEAYDVLIANLDPTLARQDPPDGPGSLLERFPDGLATQEVAAMLARGNEAPDRQAAEDALIDLAGEGRARRRALGDDALWLAAA